MTTTLLCMSLSELAAQVQVVFTDYEKKQNEIRTLTALEARTAIGVSAQMLWRWQRAGILKPVERANAGNGVDRHCRYADVIAFIASRTKSKKEASNGK